MSKVSYLLLKVWGKDTFRVSRFQANTLQINRFFAWFPVRDFSLPQHGWNFLEGKKRSTWKDLSFNPYSVLWTERQHFDLGWGICDKSFKLRNWSRWTETLIPELWKFLNNSAMISALHFYFYWEEPIYQCSSALGPVKTRLEKFLKLWKLHL